MTALEYIMEPEPGHTFNTKIAVVLTQILGNEPKYESKLEVWEEAMNRLYPMEPESESESETSTIEVDMEESDETIEVDLESLD